MCSEQEVLKKKIKSYLETLQHIDTIESLPKSGYY